MSKNQCVKTIICVYSVSIIITVLILNAEWYKQQQNGALSALKQIFDNTFDIMFII